MNSIKIDNTIIERSCHRFRFSHEHILFKTELSFAVTVKFAQQNGIFFPKQNNGNYYIYCTSMSPQSKFIIGVATAILRS